MADKAAKYAGFKRKQAQKRRTDKKEDKKVADFITVQRLSPNVEGRCQKYGRIGPLSIVHYPYDSLTLENIKQACTDHFRPGPYMSCDVLAGERGPSYTSIEQAKTTNLIHIRFFYDNGAEGSRDDDDCVFMKTTPGFGQLHLDSSQGSSVSVKRNQETLHDDSLSGKHRTVVSDSPRLRKTRKQSDTRAFPKSVPLSKLLGMGKLIEPSTDEVLEFSIEEFSVVEEKWLVPFTARVSLSQTPFDSGYFRDAFKARVVSDCSLGQRGSIFVLKKFKEIRTEELVALFSSINDLTRKTVQTHCIAKYYASKLKKEVRILPNYGDSFAYCDCYLASSQQGDLYTLEEFVEGEHQKFINNDGTIVSASSLVEKAEAFSHFTYVKSNKAMMVLDIQGSGFTLYDPEIATATKQADVYHDGLFCGGNLHTKAIKTFLSEHCCNKFCRLLGLPNNTNYTPDSTVDKPDE